MRSSKLGVSRKHGYADRFRKLLVELSWKNHLNRSVSSDVKKRLIIFNKLLV